MLICYCNSCKHIQTAQSQSTTVCERCAGGVKVYPALQFSRHLFGLLQKSQVQIRQLTAEIEEYKSLQNGDDGDDYESFVHANDELNNIDLSQTDYLTTTEQHEPLRLFFAQKNIKTIFDYQAVNTSGYYDEAAVLIGKNYVLLKKLLVQISFAYQKKHTGTNLDLSKYSQNDSRIIHQIAKEFYNHALFARVNYNKQSKKLNVVLQNTKLIREFLMGGWLEWYALSLALATVNAMAKKPKFACAKGVKIQLSNGDRHELDLVLFNQRGELFVIECKTGEYRHDLNKYLDLTKKLGINPQDFWLLVTDINAEQASSMSAMYGLTFVTMDKLPNYMAYVFG